MSGLLGRARLLALMVGVVAVPGMAAPLSYTVEAEPAQQQLRVRVCGGDSGTLTLAGAPAAAQAMRQVERSDGGAIELTAARLHTPDWRSDSCLVYRIDLATAASASRQRIPAANPNEAWLLAPDAWLWRQQPPAPAQLQVHLPDAWRASLPWPPLRQGEHRYALPAAAGTRPAWSAFGRFAQRALDLPGGRIELSVLAPADSAVADRLLAWQSDAAALLLQAYGRLPLAYTQILIVPLPGSREPVPWAQSTRGGAAALQFYAGAQASATTLREDWTAAHEYAHLLHPWLGNEGSWLAEGLASYYQNLLRTRAGEWSPEQGWQRLHAGLARGRAAAMGPTLAQSARLMHRDRNYMRVYWSGAAFWLEADLALRKASAGRWSVDAALARFAACCLPQTRAWTAAGFIAELDRGLGSTILLPLYERYRQRRDFPDLSAAYAALGLHPASGRADPASAADAAALRAAIMAPRNRSP